MKKTEYNKASPLVKKIEEYRHTIEQLKVGQAYLKILTSGKGVHSETTRQFSWNGNECGKRILKQVGKSLEIELAEIEQELKDI